MKKISIKKKIAFAVLLVIGGAVALYFDMIVYGARQLKGQLYIISNTVPVDVVLGDSSVDPQVRAKLLWIREISRFAEDSLGLPAGDNYQTYFDSGDRPVLWVVTACPRFSLDAHKWDFPFLGKLGYKGFFDRSSAENEKQRLDDLGYDTDISEVTAWSTLGFLSDPVMSRMLKRDSARLAELIIHELTHTAFYLPSQADLNENAATFFGREGTVLFLRHRGLNEMVESYVERLEDKDKLRAHLKRGADELAALYGDFDDSSDKETRADIKRAKILEIMKTTDTLQLNSPHKYTDKYVDGINNTFFTGYLMYNTAQDSLRREFDHRFNSDFRSFLEHFKAMQ